jgi:MarR family transcriptional regulator, organic hydroperoxide resistance regulator
MDDQEAADLPAAAGAGVAGPDSASGGLYDDFLPYLVSQLAHRLNLDLVDKLRREDINVARWRILAVLSMGDGITISEIIDRAMLQQSALSRVLMKMEQEQFVVRRPGRTDSRFVEVYLTDRGRALFKTLDPLVRRRQERLLNGFTPDEAAAAFALVRRMLDNLKA